MNFAQPNWKAQQKDKEAVELIRHLASNDGPQAADYKALIEALDVLHAADFAVQGGTSIRQSTNKDLKQLLAANALTFQTTASMQGFARCKPHGYAGDFEIIERIYNHSTSGHPGLVRWDNFFHMGDAPKAVRNRAAMLATLLQQTEPRSFLTVGCGPGLDLLSALGSSRRLAQVELLDNDPNAIARAKVNTRPLLESGPSFKFTVKNALRFRPSGHYDFIWSSGLFDYLNDKTACFLLKRLKEMLNLGGSISIGNFGNENRSRSYMEIIGEWFLIHRKPADLERLAIAAGFKRTQLRVDADETGLNLFLTAVNG